MASRLEWANSVTVVSRSANLITSLRCVCIHVYAEHTIKERNDRALKIHRLHSTYFFQSILFTNTQPKTIHIRIVHLEIESRKSWAFP